MKDFNVNVYDNCGCEEWVEAFVKAVFTHAKIKTEEVIIDDMDYKRISLRAEVWDETMEPEEEDEEPGGWIEKTYTIKYYEEDKWGRHFALSYVLHDDERVIVETKRPDGSIYHYNAPTYLEEGKCKIAVRRGKATCIRLVK